MPLGKSSALALSLIPAAVIVVYNVMENGVPVGSVQDLKNFVSSDNTLSESPSSIALKNISILVNGSSVSINDLNSAGQNPAVALDPFLQQITQQMLRQSTTPTTAATTTSTTPPPTTTSTTTTTTTTPTTTTTTPPPINLPKLSICCKYLRVNVDGDVDGSCETGSQTGSASLIGSQIWTVPGHLMRQGVSTTFLLQTATPTCRDGKFVGQLPFSSAEISADTHFLPESGILKFKNEYYQPGQYCIRGSSKSKGTLEVQMCNINCSNPLTPCVHKCCEYNEIYSMGMKGERGGCLKMDPSKNESFWSPTLYTATRKRLSTSQLERIGIVPHVIQSNPISFRNLCPRNATTVFPYGQQVADFLSTILRYPFPALRFMMRMDGWLLNPNEGQKNIAISKSIRTTKYCIDGVMNYGTTEEPFMNKEDQTVLFLCLGGAEELTSPRDPTAENMIAAQSYNRPVYTSTEFPTSTTPTTTTRAPTTTTTTPTTTTTTPTTTTTTPTTTTTTPTTTTTTPTTTTTTPTTTTTTPTTTTKSPTTTPTTTTKAPTTTEFPTTSTENPLPPPVLPVCCNIDPEANEDTGNGITHHCKKTPGDGNSIKVINSTTNFWTASPNYMFTHKTTKFRMEIQPLNCNKWTKEFVHDLGKLLSPVEPVLMPNGMLKMGNDYYRKGEFCVNGIFRKTVEVLVCKTNCSDPMTPCIQKCCAPNEVYSLGVGGNKRGCIPLNPEDTPFDPPLYKNMKTKLSEKELENMTPHLIQKYPPKFQYNCYKNVTLVFPFSNDVVQLMSPLAQINLEFKLRQDGRVIYKHPSIKNSSGDLIESAFSTFNFCVDGIRHWGEPTGPYKNPEDQTILFVCAVNPPSPS